MPAAGLQQRISQANPQRPGPAGKNDPLVSVHPRRRLRTPAIYSIFEIACYGKAEGRRPGRKPIYDLEGF